MVRAIRRWMMAGVLAAALQAPGGAAQGTALSPEGLAQAVECQASPAEAGAYAAALFNDHPPGWALALRRNGYEGMSGLWTYRLARPVTIFGRRTDTVSLLNNWLVIELPRAQALALVRDRGMARVPIRMEEEYYHALDPDHGPALGAFPDTETVMAQLAGGRLAQDEANTTLFVGCNYLDVSEKDFLKGAAQADAMLMQEMGKGR